MSRSPSEFKNHHFVSKPVSKWILIEVTNAINLLASIPNLHSPYGAMWTLMGQRTVTYPLNDSWDCTKIKINRKTMYEPTHPCAVIVEDNSLTFDHFSTHNTFFNLNHYSTSKPGKWCSQVPISGFSDLEVSQDTLDQARWSTCSAGLNTHVCTYTNICLSGVVTLFEWRLYWLSIGPQ